MKLFIINLIKLLFIPFGILISAINGNRSGIAILMYHRVNDEIKKEMAVPCDIFEWQMDYLEAHGYEVISMDEAVERMILGCVGGRTAVLTFDDGYEDFYISAYPVLKSHGFPSIIYVVPGYIEKGRIFWWDKDINESRLMNWRQIRELSQGGLVAVGSHTLNHSDLNRLDYDDIKRELTEAHDEIERRLDAPVRHFSYPRGLYTDKAVGLVEDIYRSAVLMSNGETGKLLKLKRIPVQRSDGRYLFAARLKGWLQLEEWLRKRKIMWFSQTVRRVRGA